MLTDKKLKVKTFKGNNNAVLVASLIVGDKNTTIGNLVGDFVILQDNFGHIIASELAIIKGRNHGFTKAPKVRLCRNLGQIVAEEICLGGLVITPASIKALSDETSLEFTKELKGGRPFKVKLFRKNGICQVLSELDGKKITNRVEIAGVQEGRSWLILD